MERKGESELRNAGDRSAVIDVRRYTRLEAVECQIGMAIRARLQFDDPVSALTLLGAAERVLSDLCGAPEWGENALSIKLFIEKFANNGKHNEAAKFLRKPYNRLKHANTDPEIEPTIDLHMLDTLLMMVIREFENQSRTLTPLMLAYKCWAATSSDDWGAEELLGEPLLKKLRAAANGRSGSALFNEYHFHFESKSLIPNPKSLKEPAP
ncbi:MAG TPA: hypothetical protein DEA50_01710 [Parvularcula sp.]|nr:hypothetical protein [Parvularcula sp.]